MSITRSSTLSVARPGAAGAPTLEPGLRDVRAAVRGAVSEPSRAAAIELLARSSYPNRHRDLEHVLEDDEAPSRLRYRAAISLPRADPVAASEILVAATRIRDRRVLAGVMRALGQVGGREALDAIERALPSTEGTARAHAEFAALLIAHRLGLDGFDAPAPAAGELIEMAADHGRRLHVRRAPSATAERCVTDLGSRPYGIELDADASYEFRCDRCSGAVMRNRAFTRGDALETLGRRKALFAIGALRDDSTGSYTAAAVFLTSPAADAGRVRISVHLTNGERVFAGEASVSDGAARWSLAAVKRLGAFPVRAEGTFEDGKLEIDLAASGTRILRKIAPVPFERGAARNPPGHPVQGGRAPA